TSSRCSRLSAATTVPTNVRFCDLSLLSSVKTAGWSTSDAGAGALSSSLPILPARVARTPERTFESLIASPGPELHRAAELHDHRRLHGDRAPLDDVGTAPE